MIWCSRSTMRVTSCFTLCITLFITTCITLFITLCITLCITVFITLYITLFITLCITLFITLCITLFIILCITLCITLFITLRGVADKSLARPGRKQATATKLGIYSTYSPRSSLNFLARYPNFCEPLKNKIQKAVRPTRSPR